MLAALLNVDHLVRVAGYPLLFALVMGESSGVPIPGETALITAAVLASRGKLHIELVIPLAAAAAIVGDNIGYLIGRKGGRWLLERPGRFQRQRHEVLAVGEPFSSSSMRRGRMRSRALGAVMKCAVSSRGFEVSRGPLESGLSSQKIIT